MEKLTNKEEEIMLILWKMEKAFVKEIIEQMTEPKPHYNTVSTMVRILADKGFVAHEPHGRSHKYFPKITQEEYKGKYMNNVVDNYFSNSFKNMVSFFAKKEKISKSDLEDIISMIENGNDE